MSDNTGMTLTTAKYYTPSGRLIQRDYSNSIFEYYNIDPGEAGAQNDEGRETRYTDNERTVYGGGGITPDIVEHARMLNRFESLLSSKQVLFNYAQRLTAGEVPSAQNFKLPEETIAQDRKASGNKVNSTFGFIITEEILSDFRQYLRDRNIEFTEDDLTSNADYIKRQLLQSVVTSHFGIQEGYKIGIEGDNQVQKALAEMPAARTLMTSGRF